MKRDLKLVSGFGRGLGSAVVMGALDQLYTTGATDINRRLLLRPFPQKRLTGKKQEEFSRQHRETMLAECGFAIFVAGNKEGENASGVLEEFEIARKMNTVPIPIGATGFAARQIWEEVMKSPDQFYRDCDVKQHLKTLGEKKNSIKELVSAVFEIIKTVSSG